MGLQRYSDKKSEIVVTHQPNLNRYICIKIKFKKEGTTEGRYNRRKEQQKEGTTEGSYNRRKVQQKEGTTEGRYNRRKVQQKEDIQQKEGTTEGKYNRRKVQQKEGTTEGRYTTETMSSFCLQKNCTAIPCLG